MVFWCRQLLIIGSILQASALLADIYKSQDSNGKTRFSDRISDNAQRIQSSPHHYRYQNKVSKVFDGDTVRLENGQRIRLLGINTPEIASRYQQDQAGGEQAKKWLQDKLSDQVVWLEYDQQREDKYHRQLAHLFLADGEHINRSLLEKGLASLVIIPPNLRYSDDLIAAENSAQQKNKGIWAMPNYQAKPITQLVGQKRVQGWRRYQVTTQQIKTGRKYVRLVVNQQCDIRIAIKNLDLFPDLTSYLNRPLEVRGWVSRKKDHYSILARHPSALIFL